MRIFLLFFILVTAGCTTTSNLIVDDQIDFQSLKTFSVKPVNAPVELPSQTLFLDLIAQSMVEKGLRPVSDGGDIVVRYSLYFGEEQDPSTLSIGLGTGSASRSGSISIGSIFSVPVGNDLIAPLILNVSMTKEGKEIWFNADRVNINKNDPANYPEQQKDLVEKVLAPFPLIQRN